ncbi:phage protein NinX family protein [Pseudomonas helleri]|uniref:phage protein NinX family protein n=1 Tax=Pseudomonas helleri TaxID=1608996 RepID=UPI00069EF7B8|nr:phage protein NinX family protein [Pseudomonas helleri]
MTEFVEVKTQDLSGAALDWAVAMAEGYRVDPEGDGRSVISPKGVFTSVSVRGAAEGFGYRPSSDWNQGGPLIAYVGCVGFFFDVGRPKPERGEKWQ